MSIASTFENARRLVSTEESRWTPHYLKNRFILSQNQYPLLSLIGGKKDLPDSPGQAQIQKIITPIKSMQARSMEPKLFDWTKIPTQFQSAEAKTGLSAGSTSTLNLDSASGLQSKVLLKNRTTKQVIWVSSVSGVQITFYPFAGGASGDGADDIPDDSKWDYVGTTWEDGATISQSGINQQPVERSNYMQANFTPVSRGMLAGKIDLQPSGTDGFTEDMKSNMLQHCEGLERSFLFGEKKKTTIGSDTLYTMDGLEGVSTVEYDAGGGVSHLDFITDIMDYIAGAGGQGQFVGVGGSRTLGLFDTWSDNKVQTNMTDKEYGPVVDQINTNRGRVKVFGSEPMNERDGEAFFFRPELITHFYLPGLNTAILDNMEVANVLGEKIVIATAQTLLFHNPESVVKILNLNN